MLNTDFELFFDLELDGDGKTVCTLDNTCASRNTCGKNGICPMAETYKQAESYAQVRRVQTLIKDDCTDKLVDDISPGKTDSFKLVDQF